MRRSEAEQNVVMLIWDDFLFNTMNLERKT